METPVKKEFQEHPKILLLDIDPAIKDLLEEEGYNVDTGSLGKPYTVIKSANYESVICNDTTPFDFHEKEIVVIDLWEKETLPKPIGGKRVPPEDLDWWCKCNSGRIDPRIRTIAERQKQIDDILDNGGILLFFTTLPTGYNLVFARSWYNKLTDLQEISDFKIHSLSKHMANLSFSSKTGQEVIPRNKNDLSAFLSNAIYLTVIDHSTFSGQVEVLAENKKGECVALCMKASKGHIFILPQVKDKKGLINQMFSGILQDLAPSIFPYATEHHWKSNPEYFLPNHLDLLSKKEQLEKKYIEDNVVIERDIKLNTDKYNWLHDLITENDEKLVLSAKIFLEYLGFEKVILADQTCGTIKEEDLRIENGETILIEVKGLGGTSKDEECSQIDKIVLRRVRSLNRTDIRGLYLVNHQRHKSPMTRQNPPFNDTQIQDAKHNHRGMLTTWQLFKLYRHIENGHITKEEARQALIQDGFIEFYPSDDRLIGTIKEIHHNGSVAIVDLKGYEIRTGETILVEIKELDFLPARIEGIQVNGSEVLVAKNAEVGIKINIRCSPNSKIWKMP